MAFRFRSRTSIIHRHLLIHRIGNDWYKGLTFGHGSRFAPLRPDLDPFLFAIIGEERNGIPLSTISALTQLGLDPWEEAGRLLGLANRDAIERLTDLILKLPSGRYCPAEAQQIAIRLIDVLPRRNIAAGLAETRHVGPLKIVGDKAFWAMCFVLAVVALVITLVNG
jgi:hypothetical protein